MNSNYTYTQYIILFSAIAILLSIYFYRLYIDIYKNKKIITDLSPDDIYFRPDWIITHSSINLMN